MLHRLARLGLVLALGTSLSSCFAVTDLDRFEKNSGRFVDLSLTVRGMKSHVAELFEYRIVDSENIIQSRGLAFPLGGVDATFFAPRAVPTDKPVRIDFFADHNNTKAYDSTPAEALDHAWRIEVDLSTVGKDGVVVVFDHNTSFQYLNDRGQPPGPPREVGKPGVLRFSGMGSRLGRRLQVRYADSFTGRVVALYRYPNVDKDSGELTVPGMIEAGNTYTVEVTVDDEKGTQESWRFQRDSTEQGLDVAFDPTTADAARVSDAPRP